MSLLFRQMPHASCCFCSSRSNGVLRARNRSGLGCGFTAGFAISTERLKKSRTLRTLRWRSEVEKDVIKPARDPSNSLESAEVSETGTDSLSRTKRGFGSGPAVSSSKLPKDNISKVKRSATIRRAPPARPVLVPQIDPRVRLLETVFIFSWAILGVVILTEGLVLGASGFLPEEWDNVLAKYLYPSFTPTVGLFLVGAVFYGLLKYFDGGNKSS